MRFLLSNRAAADGPGKVLIVQTCNPNLLEYVIRDAADRWPGSDITVLLQRNMRGLARLAPGIRAIDNPGSGRAGFAKGLKQERFDLVAVVAAPDPGFWKLKLLPLYLNPRRLVVYDRHARPRDLGLAGLAGQALGPIGGAGSRRLVLRKLLAPFIAAALFLNYCLERARRGK